MKRARVSFAPIHPPRCFNDPEEWMEWNQVRVAWRASCPSPCVDCTPEFRGRMRDECRCDRPEVIFVRLGDEGVEGICADDPRYAGLLRRQSPWSGREVGRVIERNPVWTALLSAIRDRAHREVRPAIDQWLAAAGEVGT